MTSKTHIAITLTRANDTDRTRPLGVTQLQNHLLDVLCKWQPRGIPTPDIAVIDGTETNNQTGLRFVVQRQLQLEETDAIAVKAARRDLLNEIAVAHVTVLNTSPRIAECIANNQIVGENRGFAEEMLLQYGGIYLDDDGTTMAFTTKRLLDIMGVLGYPKQSNAEAQAAVNAIHIDPNMTTDRKQSKLSTMLGQFAKVALDRGTLEARDSEYFDAIHTLFDQEIERRREAEIEVERLRQLLAAKGAPQTPVPPARGENETTVGTRVVGGYERLYHYLTKALEQAQAGKGAERHSSANTLPFDKQRMQTISQLIKSPDGMVFQACKKLTEGMDMPTFDRQERELLGVINYVAGILIYLHDHQAPVADEGDF